MVTRIEHMIESSTSASRGDSPDPCAGPGTPEAVAVGWVADLVEQLSHLGSGAASGTGEPADDGGTRLALIEELTRVTCAAAAARVRLTASFVAQETQRVEAERDRVRRERRAGTRSPDCRAVTGPGVALVVGAQVGLARHESPARGRRYADAAVLLVRDLPHTLAALSRGDLDEERAMVVVRETEHLAPTQRRILDAELAAADGAAEGPDALGGPVEGVGASALGTMGPEALRQAVVRLSLRLDDEAVSGRMRRARRQRRVVGRLLGDGTGQVSAVLPDEHYASVMAALAQAAGAAAAAGDSRTRDQVKADTFVARLTGLDTTRATPVAVNLVISVESLLGHSSEPGFLHALTTTAGRPTGRGSIGGYIPAGLCADLVSLATADSRASLRRLFTAPGDDQLVAMENRARLFDRQLAMMINFRDGGLCRTVWCDAPVRHADHVTAAADDGATSLGNGQGLCEACNLVKETPGWDSWATTDDRGRHEVGTLTPHGHLHLSHPPGLPRPPGPGAGMGAGLAASRPGAPEPPGVPAGRTWLESRGFSTVEAGFGARVLFADAG